MPTDDPITSEFDGDMRYNVCPSGTILCMNLNIKSIKSLPYTRHRIHSIFDDFTNYHKGLTDKRNYYGFNNGYINYW